MKQPKVTIVIPVFNRSKKNDYLIEAINSALSQTYKNLEIIVVNDGSDDKGVTRKIALSYGDKITYIEKENGGVSSALNLAIEKMNGEYFSWLSHDDVYYEDKIKKQIDYLNAQNLINTKTIVYSDYEVIDKNSKHVSFGVNDSEELNNKPEYSLLRGAVNGLTLLIPKSAFKDHGNFSETLVAVQDYELWYRFLNTYNFVHIPQILVKSRYHSRQVTHTSPKVITEGNEFWLHMIKEIPKKRKIELEGTEYNFYNKMRLFLEQTPYNVPLNYVKEQLIKAAEEETKLINEQTVDIILFNAKTESEAINSIDKVIKQTYKKINIKLVDTNNLGNAKSIKNLLNKYKNIEVLNFSEDLSIQFIINEILKKSVSDYISFLDINDVWENKKTEKQLEKMILTKSRINYMSYSFDKDNKSVHVYFNEDYKNKYTKINEALNIELSTIMIDTKFINKNKIYIKEKYKYAYDICFWLNLLEESRFSIVTESYVKVANPKNTLELTLEQKINIYKEVLSFVLNNENYLKLDQEISTLAFKYVKAVNHKNNNFDFCNNKDNKIIRNIKKTVTYIKNEGLKNTIVRIKNKVKRIASK